MKKYVFSDKFHDNLFCLEIDNDLKDCFSIKNFTNKDNLIFKNEIIVNEEKIGIIKIIYTDPYAFINYINKHCREDSYVFNFYNKLLKICLKNGIIKEIKIKECNFNNNQEYEYIYLNYEEYNTIIFYKVPKEKLYELNSRISLVYINILDSVVKKRIINDNFVVLKIIPPNYYCPKIMEISDEVILNH